MTPVKRSDRKRTIVLLSPGIAVLLLAAGCAGLPQRPVARSECLPPRTQLCEPFGPESRCRCADPAAVKRALAGLGALPADLRRW